MRRDDDVGEGAEDRAIAVGQGVAAAVQVAETLLVLDGVERGPAEAPGLDGRHERLRVDEAPARGVHEHGAGPHLRELGSPDHVVVLGQARRVQRHHVGRGEQLAVDAQKHLPDHRARQRVALQRLLRGQVHVAAVFAVQGAERVPIAPVDALLQAW